MQQIREQTTQAGYIAAATIEDVWASPGGYYNVQAGAAFMELQYVPPGQGLGSANWTNEVLVPVGTGNLTNGTTGVRFRDAGSSSGPAIVTAALSAEAEPLIVVGAPGSLVLAAGGTITGIIPAAGQTATAGSGFAYTHTNGTGVYVFTFATAFAATPDIQLTFGANPVTASVDVINWESASGSGFTVRTQDRTGVARDVAFSFTAQPVV